MTKENEMYAYFSLSDFLVTPAEISSRLGIQPTKTWSKGDRINPKMDKRRRFNHWSLYSRLPRTADLENHVRDVIEQMDQNKEAFQSVIQEYGATLQLVGYFYAYYPGFSLEAVMMEKIGNYHLNLDCDFYYLYSDDSENADG